jgi:hypothetical protein
MCGFDALKPILLQTGWLESFGAQLLREKIRKM